MSPLLNPGDYVLVNRWAYAFRPPVVGDLVVFRDPEREGKFLCKRIARVTPTGSFVVLGDNESLSRDSRRFGPIPRALIVGKVWPSARARPGLGPNLDESPR